MITYNHYFMEDKDGCFKIAEKVGHTVLVDYLYVHIRCTDGISTIVGIDNYTDVHLFIISYTVNDDEYDRSVKELKNLIIKDGKLTIDNYKNIFDISVIRKEPTENDSSIIDVKIIRKDILNVISRNRDVIL